MADIFAPRVSSRAEIAAANAAIDARMDKLYERKGIGLRNSKPDTPMSGDGVTGRRDLGRCLEWPSPDGDLFRRLLAHPTLLPYYNELCGSGYRMDHLPLVLAQDYRSEGFQLHGGAIAPVTGRYQPHLEYSCRNRTMHNMLLGCTVQLCDHDDGDGGFCIVRGSHKANFAMPDAMVHGASAQEHIYQPVTEAGDVLLFTEAAVHGALPWTRRDKQRRVALFRFAPATVAYGRNYCAEGNIDWPGQLLHGVSSLLSDAERAVLQPPYTARLDRPVLVPDAAASGGVSTRVETRSRQKKEFDEKVLGQNSIGL